ncbi:hypothetical protein BS78_10G215100 [Paspalum vaginatum]|nr:hypothetical protein BS78_10G215100 [Paspalum vaginatum]
MGIHALGSGCWSELPADVLITVLEGLAILDLCRTGAVCRGWRTASSYVRGQHRALSRPRTPCLLYTAASSSSSSDPFAAMLYSITDGRSYPVPLNAASIPGGELWLGASHGWLVTVDDHAELHLVNPVTGQRIDSLPSVATIEQVRRVHDDSGAVVADRYLVYPYDWSLKVLPQELDHPMWLDSHQLIKYLYVRALISSDPSGGGDCVVVLIHWPHYQLSFARPGDAHWTWIRPPQDNTEYCDCAFDGDGRTLYALRYDGAIHAFDLHGCPTLEREVILHPQVHPVTRRITKYLIHAPWLGCWLQVWRNMELIDPTGLDEATEWMKVYKVDLAAQKLVEIEGIGDHAVFVGCNYSFFLTATDCPGILPNHIYYTDSEEYYALYMPIYPRDIGIYNVGEGTFHKVQPPCPWSNWPLPTWIAPSLT